MHDEEKRGDHDYVNAQFDDQCRGGFPPKLVFDAECRAIDQRRKYIKDQGNRDRTASPITGLTLSGGGIRSASFTLGALQALHVCAGIEGIDYLSSVSGGGYIGCSLTATMQKTNGRFPFTNPDNYDDTDAVHHIKDYSNYLIPHGLMDAVTAIGIFGRGLVANILIVLPVLLFCVWITLITHPTVKSLDEPRFLIWNLADGVAALGFPVSDPLWGLPGFWFTAILAVVNVEFLIVWAVWTSLNLGSSAILRGGWIGISKVMFLVTLTTALFEFQALILRWIAQSSVVTAVGDTSDGAWSYRISYFAAIFASMGTIVAFLSKYLSDIMKELSSVVLTNLPGWPSRIKKLLALAALWLTALIAPTILWITYLWLTYYDLQHGSVLPFFGALVAATIVALLINPNRTSLYRLYLDRLGKAFLFDPTSGEGHRDLYGDLKSYDPKLFEIDTDRCPYPIINATLNIEGSQYANKRGRNADFFIFTPEYLGSDATGYIGTRRIDTKEPTLNLGTAMVISGATVSSKIGKVIIRPLTFTLALLNIRLGYWLRNPCPECAHPPTTRLRERLIAQLFKLPSIVLFMEMFGWITEKSPKIFLTDGGNIENLGVYPLLKRRCKVIISIDSEADPTLRFRDLLKVERYVRDDLGAIVNLPWQSIRDRTLEINKAFDEDDSAIPCLEGPHCAIGEIAYGPNETGILVYVKASLTGDEPDYVIDYKRRNREFPHETTGDQSVTHEQLVAYRVLGFHIMKGLLNGEAPFAVKPRANETEGEARLRILKQVRAALGAPVAR